MARAFSACRPRPSTDPPPVDRIRRKGLLRERRNAGTGRRSPGYRQDPMTNSCFVATDPILPPHGLEGAVYAIGNFDGLHRGHQAFIGRAVAMAKESAGRSGLLTFET